MLPLDHLQQGEKDLKAPVEKEAQEAKVKARKAEKATKVKAKARKVKKTKKVKAKAKARKYNTVATLSKVPAQGMPKIVGIGTRRLAETGKRAHARKRKPNVDFYMQRQ